MIERKDAQNAAADETPENTLADREEAQAKDSSNLVERIQRLQAEFENYKKRVGKEWRAREEGAVDAVLRDFLPLYDALQLAFENLNRDQDTDAFTSGVERIFAQFEQILTTKDVRRIAAIGEVFDPAVHEALMSLPSTEEKNRIVEEFSPGYVRGDRTLRPSKVGVSQGPGPAEEEEV